MMYQYLVSIQAKEKKIYGSESLQERQDPVIDEKVACVTVFPHFVKHTCYNVMSTVLAA